MIRNRYRRIVLFFGRILLSFAIWDLLLPRVGFRNWSRRTRPARLRQSARSFRILAIRMGGVLIKVGQFLSTRVDVLPVEITNELAGLQDEVPPESYEDIRLVAESEFNATLLEKFASFEEMPLAAASLGQVHRATIQGRVGARDENSFKDVVVKVQRPNIESLIATDLAALETVGKWLRRYRPISRRADIPALLREFTRILYEEIDYLAEGRNAETFEENFNGNSGVRVPQVIWSHTTKRVLTLENVWAIKISDYQEITTAGIGRSEVASRLLDTYLKQIFEDGFFHADPHPGNLFVEPLPLADSKGNRAWQLTFIDFGMVGRVPKGIKNGLRELLIAVGTRDSARVVKAYQMLGVLLPGADEELLQKAQANAFERFWGKNMNQLQQVSTAELREFSDEFRELIYAMPFQIPQDFIFLVRVVGILSGMCTGLDPNFNVWDHVTPFAQKLIAEEVKEGREIWLEEFKSLARSLLALPIKLDSLLVKIERGEIGVRAPEVSQQITRLEITIRQVVIGIVFAAFLIGGAQLILAERQIPGGIFLGLAGICFFWMVLTGRRN